MTDVTTLSYTSTSKIPSLSYTWSLKKIPCLGGASVYRPLWWVPPGKHPTCWFITSFFNTCLLKFINCISKGEKIVVKATVQNESTVYVNNDEVKQTVKQMIKSLKSLLNHLRRVRIQCGFHLRRQEIVFLLPCKHTQEGEFAFFPETHRQA